MNATLDRTDTLDQSVDSAHAPRCEAPKHAEGIFGHQPNMPAEFIVFCPCGAAYLCCRGRVENYITAPRDQTTWCICGKDHPSRDFTWANIS